MTIGYNQEVETVKTDWTQRADKLVDQIEWYRDVKFRYPVFTTACNKVIKVLDRKLTRILKPHLEGVTVAGEITDADIEKANQYPIENLFPDHKKMKICCIFHNDKNPSATIGRNNRYKCFSCGKSASVIDCYMKLNGVGFTEAVKALR